MIAYARTPGLPLAIAFSRAGRPDDFFSEGDEGAAQTERCEGLSIGILGANVGSPASGKPGVR